jgi:hypothetical protein
MSGLPIREPLLYSDSLGSRLLCRRRRRAIP